MIKIVFILILGLLVSGCNNGTSTSSDSIPEMMQPNWTGVNIDDIPVKFGQVLRFKNDSLDLTAIVLDFDKDDGGKWIGLCFLDNNQLFGRQIPSGMSNSTCFDLLDLTYLQIDGLQNFELVKSINLNKSKIGIGSISPAMDLAELERDFKRGIERRKKEQTPCDKGLTDLNPVRECYFDLDKIKN